MCDFDLEKMADRINDRLYADNVWIKLPTQSDKFWQREIIKAVLATKYVLDELKKVPEKKAEASAPAMDLISHAVQRAEREIKDLRERVYGFLDDLKEQTENTNIRYQRVSNELDDLRDALKGWVKETQ